MFQKWWVGVGRSEFRVAQDIKFSKRPEGQPTELDKRNFDLLEKEFFEKEAYAMTMLPSSCPVLQCLLLSES